jgi:intracellular multiplication protein IcmE
MSLIPSTHSRFAWFQTGVFGGAGRGGPGRLVAIVGVLALMAGGVFLLSVRHGSGPPISKVAKMKPGNLLPGGLQGTPAQDALQKEDSQEKAKAAEAVHKSYTPPIPSSTAVNGPLPSEVGMGAPVAPDVPAATPMPPAPAIVTPAAPRFTPPERPVFDRPTVDDGTGGARVTKIAAGDVEGDGAQEEGKNAREQRQRAIGDLVNSWSVRPPQTTVVIQPAALKQGADDPPASGNRLGGKAGDSSVTGGRVLVPAGRGIYAHTVVAVDSDTNGPIVLEADTGPISGDRMIGTFSKSGIDRLIVKVETVEHRGTSLEANGLVIAPDSMETAVASSIDEHYVERFLLPAASAFMSGLGQAVALGNSTNTVSPFGGTTSTIGPLTFKQEALVAAGASATAVSSALSAETPKGPTVHLAANVSVGVMFLSNLTVK